MIAIDTNVLIYAHRREQPLHERARSLIEKLAASGEPWAIPVSCLSEFVRLATHPKVFQNPHTPKDIGAAVHILIEAAATVIYPQPGFETLFLAEVETTEARGNLVFDAQIVTVCRQNAVTTLISEDRDFAKFARFNVQRL